MNATMQSKRSHQDVYSQLFGVGLVIRMAVVVGVEHLLGPQPEVLCPAKRAPGVALSIGVRLRGTETPHLGHTTRFIGGFMIGAVPALWLGFIMGRNRRACLRYGPILAVLGLTPMLSALPWFIIWFGVRDFGKWAIVSAAVFYPILYCTSKGVSISKRFSDERAHPVFGCSRTTGPILLAPGSLLASSWAALLASRLFLARRCTRRKAVLGLRLLWPARDSK